MVTSAWNRLATKLLWCVCEHKMYAFNRKASIIRVKLEYQRCSRHLRRCCWVGEKGVIKCELFHQRLFIAWTRSLHASTRYNNHHQHTTSTTTTDCVVVLDWLRQLVLCRLGRPSKGDLLVGRSRRSVHLPEIRRKFGADETFTPMIQLKLLLIFLLHSRAPYLENRKLNANMILSVCDIFP